MRRGTSPLSRSAEDALAILTLGHLHQVPVRACEIAAAIGRPTTAINQTLRTLCATGLLRSLRGSQGGFWLPHGLRISALDAVRAIAPLRHFAPCRCAAPCRLCALLEAATSDLERALGDCELVPAASAAGPGCTCGAAPAESDPTPHPTVSASS